jgi:hypothetical protein
MLTGATGRYFVTPHAVRAFIAKIAPRMCFEQARVVIIEGLANAGPEKPTKNRSAFYVRVRGRWNFRAVIGRGEGSHPAVITILRSGR